MVTKEMSKEIHAKAAPFIQWLKEAEEESSDDDDGEANSDEEVEVIHCCCTAHWPESVKFVMHHPIGHILHLAQC